MRSLVGLFLALSASLAAARPALQSREASPTDPNSWAPPVREYYEAVGSAVANIRSTPSFPNPPPCDLDRAVMAVAPTPLPAPSEGLKLLHVAVGRGTQNYTCADSTAQSKPVAAGAVARLYNATCAAANYPQLLARLPNASLVFGSPAVEDEPLHPAPLYFSGDHFFIDAKTPVFNVGTKSDFYGVAVCAKSDSSAAPADAPAGPNGLGSVPWLKLADTGASTGFKEVYRVNTAGGVAPASCEGQEAQFKVDYATEYWFYG